MMLATHQAVQETIRQILENPPYSKPPSEAWFKFIDTLKDLWHKIFMKPVEWLGEAPPFVYWLVLIGLFIILILLLAHMGWTFYKFIHFPLKKEGAPVSPRGPLLSPVDLEKKAAALAAEKNYSEALRYLFLALLGFFNVEQPSKSKTPRECVRLIPLEGSRKEGLKSFVGLFERAFFGLENIGVTEFEKGCQFYRDLR